MEEVIHPVEEVIHTLVILVSAQGPSPFGLDFWTLDFGTSDLGLTILSYTFTELNLLG